MMTNTNFNFIAIKFGFRNTRNMRIITNKIRKII